MVFRAAISIKADITHVVPVAAVSYIDLRVVGTTDATGRFRITFDEFVVIDRPSFVLSRPRADSVALSDSHLANVAKALGDVASIEDSLAALLLFLREFSDDTSVADSDSFVFSLATQQELVPIFDVTAYDMTKLVQDGFAMNDGSEAVDGSQYSIHKGISNVAFAEDTNSLIFAASRVESVDVSDEGALLAQGYCDLSYFAEDYVGAARVF